MRFEIRLNKETADKLEKCAKKLDITKTDVIKKGIDLVEIEVDKKINIVCHFGRLQTTFIPPY